MPEPISCANRDHLGAYCEDDGTDPVPVHRDIDLSWRARILIDNLQVRVSRLSTGDCRTIERTIAEMIKCGSDDNTVLLIARGLMCLGRSKEEMGLDCSGFIRHLCAQNGTSLPPQHLWAAGDNGCTQMVRTFGTITEEETKTGDLVFFNHDGGNQTASHVGLLVVNEDGSKSVLHMTDHGVKLNRLWDADGHRDYWGNRSPCFSRNPALR